MTSLFDMARKRSKKNPLKNQGFAAGTLGVPWSEQFSVPEFQTEAQVWPPEALGVMRIKARMLGLKRVHFHRTHQVTPVGTGATFERTQVRSWEMGKEFLTWETYFLGKGTVSMRSASGLEAMAKELAGRNLSTPQAWRASSRISA